MKKTPSSLFAHLFPTLPAFAALATAIAPLACASAPHDAPGSDAGPADTHKAPAVADDAGADASLLSPTDASDASAVDGTVRDGGVDASSEGGPDADGDALDATLAAIAVNGTVTDSNGTPAPGVTVNVLDGSGASFVAVTDAAGAFALTSVVTPYALTVSAAQGATPSPASYLGVTTPNPTVVSWPPAPQQAAPFTLSIVTPSCGTVTCQADITVSLPGGGSFNETGDVSPGVTFPISGSLDTASTGPLSVVVTVLVSDSVCSRYWFSQSSGTLMPGGPAAALGTMTPTPIPSAATLTSSTTYSGSAGWQLYDLFYVDYPGGGNALLGGANSPVVSCAVPDILGATLRACSEAYELDGGAFSMATVAGMPLTTTAQALSVPTPPAWVLPSAVGQAIPSSATLSWTPSAPDAVSLVLLSDYTTHRGLYVFTSATSVSLPQLARMGALPPPGTYQVSVVEFAPAGLDTALQSGSLARILDQGLPGTSSETSSTSSVTLTP